MKIINVITSRLLLIFSEILNFRKFHNPSDVTGGRTSPSDTIHGGDTLMKVHNFCGWIYKEHGMNDLLEGGEGGSGDDCYKASPPLRTMTKKDHHFLRPGDTNLRNATVNGVLLMTLSERHCFRVLFFQFIRQCA